MKTAFGKLTMLAFLLILGIMLLAPMRAGIEDTLTIDMHSVVLNSGETVKVGYQLDAEKVQTVTYTSEDPAIAEVDQLGNVTAISPGKTRVVLTAEGGASARLDVEVAGTAVTSFELNTRLLELEKGSVSGLSCVFNAGATDRRVEWMSADPDVVKVDAAGRVTAVGGGETYVVATTPGGFSAAATVRVHVRGTAVQITPGDLIVGVGATFPLDIYYLPEDTTDLVAQWHSSDSSVATVSGDGVVHAVSVGTAVISVTTEAGLTGSIAIEVESAAKDFQINPTSVTIERGDSHTLEAWFIGEDGEPDSGVNHHIDWTSSEPGVATVQDGVITGLSSGLTRITASADGFESVCSVRVVTSVRAVNLNMTELYLLQEQTAEPFQLKASVEPADADDRALSYASDNELVASVSAKGLVTLTGGYGTAVITVTAASGAEATFTVHVVTELPETQGENAASVQAELEPEDV